MHTINGLQARTHWISVTAPTGWTVCCISIPRCWPHWWPNNAPRTCTRARIGSGKRRPVGNCIFAACGTNLSAADSHYGWGVTVQGDQPLRLVRHRRLAATDRQLIVTVSCGVPTASPARIEVLAVGRLLAAFDVPVLDRDHVNLIPQKIPLDNLEVPTDGSVEFEIRQYPGPAETPVQWHGIEFASSG